MATTRIYIFKDIPGAGKGWRLGVDAISRKDASTYVRNVCRGGKYVMDAQTSGLIPCDCMATTEARQEQIRVNFERWMNES